jgi:N-acetylglucosaminyldiphosphoundecaprenol N-acetyl-beta-D-mannosaminyltransferase
MRSARVLGCRVDAVDPAEAVRAILELAAGPKPSLVVTLGTEMVMRAQSDDRFRAVVERSALSLCDTAGVEFAARLAGTSMPRVAGIELIDALAHACAAQDVPIYLLGAKGDTAQRAAAELVRRHPGLTVAGARDGYFAQSESAAVAAQIAAAAPRLVFVALGSPRQEFWIDEHLAATGAGAGIGVGGSFDVLAGTVSRAPAFWRRMNLEWFYRLLSEPSRWRRQLALPKFAVLVLGERFGFYRTGGMKA